MTPEEITALFAEAANKFSPIAGAPTDDDLTALRETLYPLLLSIPYDEDGRHNLIGLIEPPSSYIATWGEAFPVPARPPAYDPAIAADATPVVRARMEAAHALVLRDFATYEATERAVAKFIRDTVDDMWYKDLKDARTFYNSVSAAQLLHHLDENCGGLHPAELVNLPTEMLGYYALADGIPEYINMLEDAQRKLARAHLPMTDDQLLAIASTAVLASQHFPRATDDWEARPRATKTWAHWKTQYRAAHTARKRQLLAAGTTGTGEPLGGHTHAANAAQLDPNNLLTPDAFTRLDGYLDNLANAATQEKTTLAQLIDNNASLTSTVTSLTTALASLTTAYTLLANGPPPAASAAKTASRSASSSKFEPGGYCWTHGYKVSKGHSSATCSNKSDGHKDTATRANIMGGSKRNKDWDA